MSAQNTLAPIVVVCLVAFKEWKRTLEEIFGASFPLSCFKGVCTSSAWLCGPVWRLAWWGYSRDRTRSGWSVLQ